MTDTASTDTASTDTADTTRPGTASGDNCSSCETATSPATRPSESDAATGPLADLQRHPLVLFDGVCGLCHQTVDFILRHDRHSVFRFSPLQGETAAHLAKDDPALKADLEDLSTLIVVDHRGLHRRSSAVVAILGRLGTGWKLLGGLLWAIPRPVRNLGYRLVSKYRYRLFGKKDSCRMPTPDERARFLD